MSTKNRGRPVGRLYTHRVQIDMDDVTQEILKRLVNDRQKAAAKIIRDFIRDEGVMKYPGEYEKMLK